METSEKLSQLLCGQRVHVCDLSSCPFVCVCVRLHVWLCVVTVSDHFLMDGLPRPLLSEACAGEPARRNVQETLTSEPASEKWILKLLL